MISMHQTHRSEWDDSYINLRLSADDARWAVVVIVAFAIAALLA